MTDKPRHLTPTEQAAMDARPGEPDASGDPERMISRYVRYIGASIEQIRWGSCDDPRQLLNVNQVYEVESRDVRSWHTKIKLVGIDGWFNSVSFEPWLTLTEQAAMDARPNKSSTDDFDYDGYHEYLGAGPEPDASGAPQFRTGTWGAPQNRPLPTDKQQPAQRHDNINQERWQRLVNAVADAFNQGTVPGSNTESVEWAIQTIHAQAAEIAVLSDALNDQATTIVKKGEQNAALREALREYLDWHETNFVLPSGNFEDPDQMVLAKAARAALEASDE